MARCFIPSLLSNWPHSLATPLGSYRSRQSTTKCTSQLYQTNFDHKKYSENLTKVRTMLSQETNHLKSMRTINSLQQLGLDYHFTEDIKIILDSLYKDFGGSKGCHSDNLFEVALCFRLLRQAGYDVPSDVFDRFVDSNGEFKLFLSKDIEGLLSLHEASYLNTGEEMLYKAREFSRMHLNSSMEYLEPSLASFVRQSLEHSYHMTIQRYKIRHYFNHYKSAFDQALQELAVMDFNITQSLYQREFKEFTSWWTELRLTNEIRFARDQPLIYYLWSTSILPNPQFSKYRIQLAKVIAFIYLIDDIFDACGSLDELYLFNKAINIWELSIIDSLPNYMRACYIALYNITNEIAHMVLQEHGWNPINSFKRSWIALCNAFLVEVKWFTSTNVPSVEDYLRNGTISIGAHVVLVHTFVLLGEGITNNIVDLIDNNPALISCPATILRLWDDLNSDQDENQHGFDGSYMECFMKENPNCSTQSAEEHVMHMISKTWEKLNRACISRSPFTQQMKMASLNFARMAKMMHTYVDKQKLPMLKEYTNLLLFESM